MSVNKVKNFINDIKVYNKIKVKDIKKKKIGIINDIPIYGNIKIKDIKKKKFGVINDIPIIAKIKVKDFKKLTKEDFKLSNILQVKYVYIFFLVILFFIYGLILSELIDFIFPIHDVTKEDKYIVVEIVGEIGIVYIVYYLLKNYINVFIDLLFNKLRESRPFFLSDLLLIAFSYGIYKKLTKYNDKSEYLKKKYTDILYGIRDMIFHKTKIYYKKNIHSRIFGYKLDSEEESSEEEYNKQKYNEQEYEQEYKQEYKQEYE